VRIEFGLDGPVLTKFRAVLKKDAEGAAAAAFEAVDQTTTRLKERYRAQIGIAFPNSRRLPNVVRSEVYEAKNGRPPDGYVWCKWTNRRDGSDILAAYTQGMTLRPRSGGGYLKHNDHGRALFVPLLDRAHYGIARRLLGELSTNPRLALVKSLGNKLLLIERDRRGSTRKKGGSTGAHDRIVGLLTPQVTVRKRLDAEAVARTAPALLAERLITALAKRGL
jgi:hypothetical protein